MSYATESAGGLKVPFGLDNQKLAERLQWIADEIRAGRIYPQASSDSLANRQEDFEMVTFSITYAGPKP